MLDYSRIIGRAAWIRQKCALYDKDPPYSSRQVMETCFPDIHVTGENNLPKGITELAHRDEQQRRTIFYSRKVSHASQRVAILHGLAHFLTDLRGEIGLRECNLAVRQLEHWGALRRDPVEVACDIFAGEILTPFDVLDRLAPDHLFPRRDDEKRVFDDEMDSLASRFNVPVGFIRWRLFDLIHLRKTHFNLK